MNTSKIVILALVAAGIAAALGLRSPPACPCESAGALHTEGDDAAHDGAISGARLVELGSTTCQSCRAMHEELGLLREECGDSIAVEEIDVWSDRAAAQRYGVQVIPTQVFFDANGQEIERHVGFLARADIRARFAARGHECRP